MEKWKNRDFSRFLRFLGFLCKIHDFLEIFPKISKIFGFFQKIFDFLNFFKKSSKNSILHFYIEPPLHWILVATKPLTMIKAPNSKLGSSSYTVEGGENFKADMKYVCTSYKARPGGVTSQQ